MNILGIDYGKKRIGLAWVDTDLGVVLPFGKLENGNCPVANGIPLMREKLGLIDLIQKQNIDQIVVGLPVGLDGKENENTKVVQAFVEELKKEIYIPVEFVDERFSSRQADSMGGTVSRDEKAAMVILSSYLEANK